MEETRMREHRTNGHPNGPGGASAGRPETGEAAREDEQIRDERPRPTFRRRLLVTMGAAHVAALAGLGLLVWLGLYAWMTVQAYNVLDREARFIESMVATGDGRLRVDAYTWDEPHHRFQGPHIDPYFVQVFGPDRRLIRQSDNILFFSEGDYPGRLLATEAPSARPVLRTFSASGGRLYHITRPLTGPAGETLGFVQVARPYPNIDRVLWRAAWLLAAGLVVVLSGLGVLVWWQSGRVLRPLATITAAARRIAPNQLHERVPVPPGADRETAQLAATLNGQLARLEQAFEEMYRFTANAAHELQTPLTVLRGHVDVALRRPRTAEAYRETLALLGREIDTLSHTVRSLLVLARLDRDATRLPAGPVDLAALVRAEMPPYAAQASVKGLDVRQDVPTEAWVCGQPDLLREVVVNLLDNAIKYTRQGHLSVEIVAGPVEVVLGVCDTGIGMEAEETVHATDRFFRAAAASRLEVPGSGLGLALVSQIVARHGGQLRIDSTPGRGTCVYVALPSAMQP